MQTAIRQAPASPGAALPLGPEQLVSFTVDGRLFGIDVAKVREIKGWQPVTPIPNARNDVIGVLNLRGTVIAVYDLRASLGLPCAEKTKSSVVIVVETGSGKSVGILADGVSDILTVSPDQMRDVPEASHGDLVENLVVKDTGVTAILNVESLVGETIQ